MIERINRSRSPESASLRLRPPPQVESAAARIAARVLRRQQVVHPADCLHAHAVVVDLRGPREGAQLLLHSLKDAGDLVRRTAQVFGRAHRERDSRNGSSPHQFSTSSSFSVPRRYICSGSATPARRPKRWFPSRMMPTCGAAAVAAPREQTVERPQQSCRAAYHRLARRRRQETGRGRCSRPMPERAVVVESIGPVRSPASRYRGHHAGHPRPVGRADLSVVIAPSAENGCRKPCWAVSHLVVTTAKARLHATPLRITPDQLAVIRRQIALAVGIGG